MDAAGRYAPVSYSSSMLAIGPCGTEISSVVSKQQLMVCAADPLPKNHFHQIASMRNETEEKVG
ncbi:hypothetical protein F4823DRAFT_564721 [Ustulina deusta]|nr:hypothetical protein F4823DRAFT_564721 [Ustulina deusta]